MQKSREKQKKFLGTVPKKCQLVETFWDCPEISKTNNNGITLIALIITIIVMLILVGVTINVALNGGLFTKARQATSDYQYQEDYEILQAAVVASLDENLQIPNAETLQNNLPSGWSVTGEDAGPFTATSPNGNVFTVDKDGTITGQNGGTQTPGGDDEPDTPTEEIPDLFRKYILGQDETGRPILEILDLASGFKDDESTKDVDETQTLGVETLITYVGEEGSKFVYCVKYDNKAYKIICSNMIGNTESLELIYTPQGREGEKTTEGWTILYDNGETLEAISPTTWGDLDIGYTSTTTDEQKLSDSIDAYNNAISTINTYCQNLEGLPINNGVRSIGASIDTTTDMYNGIPTDWTTSTYNGVGKAGDTFFEDDLVRAAYWGVAKTTDSSSYYIASRYILNGSFESYERLSFCIFLISNNGTMHLDSTGIWSVTSDGNASASGIIGFGVRPIITINNP